MAKIAFVILAHENADQLIDLVTILTSWDEHAHAVIHYDLRASKAEFDRLVGHFSGNSRVHFVTDRVKCGWGDFSLVEATLRGVRLIRTDRIDHDHVMLLSGACMPIRPLDELSKFLDLHPQKEFIETYGPDWVVGGLSDERQQQYFWVNHRTRYKLFNFLHKTQKRLRIKRKMPRSMRPKFGSQWWTLTASLCERILDFLDENPDVYRFFKTTWIPDESFFQTLATHIVPSQNMAGYNLTFFQFNDWGMPLVFSKPHAERLKEAPRYFARKITPGQDGLRAELREIALQPSMAAPPAELPRQWRFPAEGIAKTNNAVQPGYRRLFAHEGRQSISESLLEYGRSFVVLYGPPSINNRILSRILNLQGLTVLGSIFSPGWVDFGASHRGFHGLKGADWRIRDQFPVHYLHQVLRRCPDLPVISLRPGDNPDLELQLAASPNVAFFPLIPKHANKIWSDLYWLLCMHGIPNKPNEDLRFLNTFLTDASSMVNTAPEIRTLVGSLLKKRDAPLPRNELEMLLAYRHPGASRAILDLYEMICFNIASIGYEDTVSHLPADWRPRFQALNDGHFVWTALLDLEQHIPPAASLPGLKPSALITANATAEKD